MSEYRGTAGCPLCLVPWAVQDWETYLSVTCPQCGRKLGEVAYRPAGRSLEVLGQSPPMGIPADRSAVVDGGPDEAAELAELHAYLAVAYPAAPQRGHWQQYWPLLAWIAFSALSLVLAVLLARQLH